MAAAVLLLGDEGRHGAGGGGGVRSKFSLSFSRPHFLSLGSNLNLGSGTMLKREKKVWK